MEPWLQSAARRAPQGPALITAEGTLTYRELSERAAAGGAELRGRGVVPGARVAVALPAGQGFAVAVHAALLAGAVVVPVDLRLTPAEQEERASGALLIDAPLLGGLGRKRGQTTPTSHGEAVTPVEVGLGTPLAILHTSGTTAAPKPVALSYGNFLASALGSAVALGLEARDRWLCPMPLVHVGGLSVLIRSAIYATTAVLHETFDTERVLAELSDPQRGITLVSLVPTMLARLLEAGLRRPPRLRWALLGGGPIAADLLARAEDSGVPVAPTYGMTEACSQIATHGWPLPGLEVSLDAQGEILVRGGSVAHDARAGDGWLHTGDLGRFDARGRLEIIGRTAETIVSGGENVAPAEVEAVLLEHPGIGDAGVFGRSDPEWGEAVFAAVVPTGPDRPTPQALYDHCAARLARYKIPKSIEFVPELPRTPTGKLLRRKLSESATV